MGKYHKSLFIIFVISLFLFISIDVSALGFNSTSVRIASWYENGQLSDSGFVSTNPILLPEYATSISGSVSLRLFQWRYTTSSPLAIGRYKITTDISFSSLDGNDINNFLSINKFDEYGCGTAYNNSTSDNMTLISHDLTRLTDTSYRFEYVFDLKVSTCNFFSGIIKYGENEYTPKYVINQYGTNNESLSYSVSYSSVEVLNNQDIIDNQDKNTQDIIDNNNQNTQDIIDNQDKNTEEQIESQKVCTFYDLSSAPFSGLLSSDGSYLIEGTIWNTSDFIKISSNDFLYSYEIRNANPRYCFYDINKINISCSVVTSSNTLLSIPSNASYFRYSISVSDNKPNYKLCKNGNQSLNDSLDNIGGAITDSSPPDTESFLDDVKNVFVDGPISTLILMPFTLLNRYVDGFNGSCSSISLGNLYGTNLSLPCIDLESRLGSTLWAIIDDLVSIFMIYNIAMLFVMVFNDITSLRDTFDSLYTPQHAKRLGKHTSEVE